MDGANIATAGEDVTSKHHEQYNLYLKNGWQQNNSIFRRGVQYSLQCGHRTCRLVWNPPPASHRSRLPHIQDVEHRQECDQEGRQPIVWQRLRGHGGRGQEQGGGQSQERRPSVKQY